MPDSGDDCGMSGPWAKRVCDLRRLRLFSSFPPASLAKNQEMFARIIRTTAGLGLILIGLSGCDRPQSAATTQNAAPTATNTPPLKPVTSVPVDLSTIHWLGKKQLAADTNAATALAIWNSPESVKLQTRTLDQLALAPWRLLKGEAATNGAPVARLRPLLDDLVTEESRLTIHHPTNQPAAWSLAIKLPAERASLWQTNLAAVLESLTGAKAASLTDGFSVSSPMATLEFHRQADGWSVLSMNPPKTDRVIGKVTPAGEWLSLSLDLVAVDRAFNLGWSLPTNCPRVSLTMDGVDRNVRTRGGFSFPQPLNLSLEPWQVPTNLIRDPLIGFTAVRGLRPFLSGLGRFWETGTRSPLPNQAYGWSLAGINLMSYLAVPVPAADAALSSLTSRLLSDGNGWLGTNGMGYFSRAESGHAGVLWAGVPFMAPFLTVSPGNDFLFGGCFPLPRTTNVMPAALLAQFVSRSNLVCYSWELTGARADAYVDVSQLARAALLKSQTPPVGAMVWLVTTHTNLGNCTTSIELEDARTLGVTRVSTLGFSAAELHLIVDWLDSPQFPAGLHTTRVAISDKLRTKMLESRGALPPSARP